ncbi:hypothetical protein [Lacrimispora brassicae]
MKKILPIVLAASLALSACGSKTVSEPTDGVATIQETTQVETETTEGVNAKGFEATYVGNGSLPIVEVDGKRYFDFSSDDFLKKINNSYKETMKEPAVFKISDKKADMNQVVFEGDNGLYCMVETDEKTNKIAAVYVMGGQEEGVELSKMAINMTPILMILDPNMDSKYAGAHLVDIALAAQINFSQSQYAYEGVHQGIRERIYGEDNFIIFNFAPADESDEPEEAAESVSAGSKPDFGKLSDDLYSYQIQVNDDVYQLPMTFDQFTTFGWQYDGDASQTMLAGSYSTSFKFKLGKMQCYAGIANFDVNTRPYSECYITSLKFETSMLKDAGDVTVTLPGGVSLGGNYDEAVTLYGTPGYEYDNETSRRTVTYSMSTRQEIKIGSVFQNREIIGDIEVENMTKPEGFVGGEVSGDVPEIVAKYKEPSKMSEKFEDFIVNFGGNLYQLPAPVSVFMENGWNIVKDASKETIPGGSASWVTLMKDNQAHKMLVSNYDENATSIENGFVTHLVSDVYDKKTPIFTARELTVGMTYEELKSALADVDYEKDESSSKMFDYIKICPVDSKINYYSISVLKETNQVTKIEVQYSPKRAELMNR